MASPPACPLRRRGISQRGSTATKRLRPAFGAVLAGRLQPEGAAAKRSPCIRDKSNAGPVAGWKPKGTGAVLTAGQIIEGHPPPEVR